MTVTHAKDGEKRCDKRSYCCPAWGAPDPATCTWRGGETSRECNGQCHPGEVMMIGDDSGDSSRCRSGAKVYCCKSTEPSVLELCHEGNCGHDCVQAGVSSPRTQLMTSYLVGDSCRTNGGDWRKIPFCCDPKAVCIILLLTFVFI